MCYSSINPLDPRLLSIDCISTFAGYIGLFAIAHFAYSLFNFSIFSFGIISYSSFSLLTLIVYLKCSLLLLTHNLIIMSYLGDELKKMFVYGVLCHHCGKNETAYYETAQRHWRTSSRVNGVCEGCRKSVYPLTAKEQLLKALYQEKHRFKEFIS